MLQHCAQRYSLFLYLNRSTYRTHKQQTSTGEGQESVQVTCVQKDTRLFAACACRSHDDQQPDIASSDTQPRMRIPMCLAVTMPDMNSIHLWFGCHQLRGCDGHDKWQANIARAPTSQYLTLLNCLKQTDGAKWAAIT